LLLTLKNFDTQREYACRECNLSSMQIEKIYCIRSFICENMDSHFTIEELSDKFDMPSTAMKLCFKNVFGLPVFTYARRERMKLAGKQRRECDRGILEIAGEVGYNNGSKFAHAFQDVMGMTPKEYRKKYKLTNVA
jgi:AraC-like DNA-binding protein